MSCHSELSVSSGDGEDMREGGRGEGGDSSPFSNGEVITNGEEADMEIDGEERVREEEEEEEGEVIETDHSSVPIEKILAFGRALQALHAQITSTTHPSDNLKTLLQVSNKVMS